MDIGELLRGIMTPSVAQAAGGGAPPAPAPGGPPLALPGAAAMSAPPGPQLPPGAAPGQPPAPPDLGTLYTKLLDQQRSDKYMDGGAALIAAGFAQPQNRAAMISGAFGAGGGSGGGSASSTLTSLMALQKDAEAKRAREVMRARLPSLAKTYGLDMDTVNYLFESGKLDETVNTLAKPDTQVVERADGSKMMINSRTGKPISEISPADPLKGKEIVKGFDGSNAVVDKLNPGAAPRIVTPADPEHGDSTELRELTRVNAERVAGGKPAISKESWLEQQATNKAARTNITLGDTLEKDAGKARLAELNKAGAAVGDGFKVIERLNSARSTLDRGIIAGSILAEPAKEARKVIAQAFGISDDLASNTDTFLAQMKEVVLPRVSALGTGNSISNADREFVEKAVAGSATVTVDTMREVMRIMEKGERTAAARFNREVDDFDKIAPGAAKFVKRYKMPAPRAKPETIAKLKADVAAGDKTAVKEFDDYFGEGAASAVME